MGNVWNRRQVLAQAALAPPALSTLALSTLTLSTLAEPARARIIDTGFEGLVGERAEVALELLRASRQASFGAGKDVWIWISSLCPYCQKYFREFPQLTVPGFRVHYIPFILGEGETGAVLKVLNDPSQATFLKFMRRELNDAPSVAYNPFYTGPLDYTGSATTLLSRHHAHIRLVQSAYDADAGFPVETGLNRQLSTPRTFFRTQKGALLMWGGGFGKAQFERLRDL
ncbi:hypothetical protein [Novosphingobium sp. MBES04]|uniref:hypothetical protein n=1 Tax=Novosphingobium sp. MBES04 TaxID=1206458 RepID=UPI00072333FD|nr:hypothetical protein [Novosphingobium sp. MBES04]GAM03352.1 hypothetical protein MBENS4_0351 [Novosphingobium sp. MBES04]